MKLVSVEWEIFHRHQQIANSWSSMINIFEMFSISICTIIKASLNHCTCFLMFIKNVVFNWNRFQINFLTLSNSWVTIFFPPVFIQKVIAI